MTELFCLVLLHSKGLGGREQGAAAEQLEGGRGAGGQALGGQRANFSYSECRAFCTTERPQRERITFLDPV